MKHILIICDVYPPEISSAAHLMQELAQGLYKNGYSTTVATTYPQYYLSQNKPNQHYQINSSENGINIIRVKTLPLKRVNFIIRGISQLVLPFLFLKKVKKHIKEKIDIVIVYSPPLTLGIVGEKIKKYYQAKFILNLQDIFPQNAIDLGILKDRFLIKFFEWIEKNVYKKADLITFHSHGGRQFLIDRKGVFSDKIVTLHNWININSFQNLKQKISFRKKWGLKNKFIFVFGGIIGPAQGLELLVKIAKKISDLQDIIFLIVGDGIEKQKIQDLIKKYNLKNIIIKPFINKKDYPYLIQDSDIGIVCLNPANKTPFVPGKFLGYLAAGKPVLALLNHESDGFDLIKKAKCGWAINSDDIKKGAELVRQIYNMSKANISNSAYYQKNKLNKLGHNGYVYALNNFSIQSCINKLEKLFH
ncbi:hypothetical protein CL633_01700 [bacterium]|nr:hypothetical protein [bacterium]|tara:strand:+ start:1419 stop:2672 length:1254 start_codon:yes stop_codon:yes gene_type:complete